MSVPHSQQADPIFQGAGEMRARCQELNWSATALGPATTWPISLRTTAQLVLASAFPNILLWGAQLVQLYNDGYRQLMGDKHPAGLGQATQQCWPEVWYINQPIYERVWQGESFAFEDTLYPITRSGQLEDAWFTLAYSPVLAESGQVGGVLVTVFETTQQVLQARRRQLVQQRLVASEARLRQVVEQALSPICLLKGADMLLELANQPLLDVWKAGPEAIGKPLLAILPEMRDQPIVPWLLDVYNQGITHRLNEIPAYFIRANGVREDHFFNFIYQPWYEADGTISGVLALATDVTEQVQARQRIQLSEARFRAVVEQGPMAIGQLKGEQMIIELGNERLFEVWGKDPSVINRPLLDALPELDGQPFGQILAEVYQTGQPFYGSGTLARLVRNGQLEDAYFDFSYTPLRDATGAIDGILIMAIEVTQQQLARQALKASETRFRTLIQEAPFAMAVYETADLFISVANEAMINLWGKTNAVLGQQLADALPELAGQPFIPLLNTVYATGQTYRTAEQSANLLINGQMETRWFNFVYQPLLDERGQVYAILNMAVDITDGYLARQQLQQSEQRYRELAADLDNRVQDRTQALLLANHDLQRSNDNLQQFAYVASHDLQEPLRKIQAFSDLLGVQLANHAESSVGDHLQRITNAAARMSTLIRDLLAYSRISTRQQLFGLVSLNEIVADVLSTLHGIIQQTEAQIEVAKLPTAKGDKAQLTQLFTNLLSNAIKFVKPEQSPRIQVQYFHRSVNELPDTVRLTSVVSYYHQISVTDNGIGFDEKYLDRIFQVFQRLNSPSTYSGTGVGLAICQRVVENHGGGITAKSEPGHGTTFCVYLPD